MGNVCFVSDVTKVLKLQGQVNFPGATNFIAREKFTEPQFSLSQNFKGWMLPKVEHDVRASTLAYGVLSDSFSKYRHIITDLGKEDKIETFLSEIFHLISIQSNGKQGVLLTKGDSTIFFVRDVNSVLRAVFVRWIDCRWRLRARIAPSHQHWRPGKDRMFYRNWRNIQF